MISVQISILEIPIQAPYKRSLGKIQNCHHATTRVESDLTGPKCREGCASDLKIHTTMRAILEAQRVFKPPFRARLPSKTEDEGKEDEGAFALARADETTSTPDLNPYKPQVRPHCLWKNYVVETAEIRGPSNLGKWPAGQPQCPWHSCPDTPKSIRNGNFEHWKPMVKLCSHNSNMGT